MADRLEFHPLANIFPMMPDAEVNDLGDDMLKHGQREPISLFEGMILDGRNRYSACLLKDIEPRFVDYRGPDALGFVISLNLKRRHLDDSQRSIVAGKLENLKHGQTKADMPIGISRSDAASMLNVSERSVARASDVIDHGTPELVNAVEQGDVSVSAAAAFAKQPKEDQAKQIEKAATPADAVKASKRAAVTIQADRAEQTAAAKLASPMPKDVTEQTTKPFDIHATKPGLIGILNEAACIDPRSATQMSDDERLDALAKIARADVWLNEAATCIAIAGGAKLGALAPLSRMQPTLEFLRAAAARIEAELAGRAGPPHDAPAVKLEG